MHAAVALLFLLPAVEPATVDYQRDVKPVLKERCFACHGALKQESGLRLDTAESIRKGGDGGPAVEPGMPAESELISRVRESDKSLRMPPDGKPLTAEQIESISAWIQRGADGFEGETAEEDPRDHWAFRTPRKSRLSPDPSNVDANPIDALLAAERRRRGLQAVGPARKSLQLRRVYLDLIGLPPTRAELRAFLQDDRPDAWDRVVDRLLASPRHGERWGRHWMDVWRYTDWFGLGAQLRYSQKHIWHWRDWIIESLNEDKGYDRMVVEMLAGDEVAPTDPKTLRATGFLARNYFLFNRTTWLDSTIEHTSKAFLGLTLNCAKCHDHKFDPLTQQDYYRMRAFFEPHQVRLDSVPGQLDLEKDGLPRVFDAHPDEPTYLHVRGNAKDPDKSSKLPPRVPARLALDDLRIVRLKLPIESHRPALRPFVLRDHLRDAESKIQVAQAALEGARASLAALTSAPKPADSKSERGKVFLDENFDSLDAATWEQGPGEWIYKDGVLHQKQAGATRKSLTTRGEHPRDFVAVLRFRTLGGAMWKSVGLAFDVNGAREKLVYLSAVKPGAKLQISYNVGAAHVYPDKGRQERNVELNRWYEMRIAVRDTLINVAIDGRHALAYRLPLKRESGRMMLVAFDVVVDFDSLVVRELAPNIRLAEAGTASNPQSLEQAQAGVRLAEATLRAAQLRPAMLKAAWHADRAKFADPPPADAKQLAAEAAGAARRFEAAVAEQALLKAEQNAAGGAPKNAAKLKAAVKAARAKLATARKAINSPGEKYTSLRASLKALEGPAETDDSRKSPYPRFSTGRRTALARWIVDARNPLAARVAVNHIWTRHFGQPLVDPLTDFGRRTNAPPLQPVLDWLAVDLIENGWSMKRLHRLIVTSRAYRMSADARGATAETAERDPKNRYLWRRSTTRMESQVVRDSLLLMSGNLDQRMGGPTLDPKKSGSRRRSLYFTHSRDDRDAFVSMFDDADILQCYRRGASIVPQQALALGNGRLPLQTSRDLSRQLSAKYTARSDFLNAAFELILTRSPTAEETKTCEQTMVELESTLGDRPDREQRVRAAVVHALINHNDFVTIR